MESDGLMSAHQLCQQGRDAQALAAVEKVLRADASNVDALILAGELYGKLGKHQFAAHALARVVQLDPENVEAALSLAAAYHRLGDLDKCDRCMDMLVASAPNQLRAQFFEQVKVAGDVDENSLAGRAVLAFDRAAERPDVSALVPYNLGRLLFALGSLDMACRAYEHALDLDPEMAEAFASVGEVAFLQGRFDQCIEWFTEARRCQWMETSTGLMFNRDYVTQHIASGDMTLGLVDRYVARALVRLGQFVEANRVMQSAIEWQPWDIEGVRREVVGEYLAMGRAAQSQGGLEAAIAVWEKAQELARQANAHELFLQLARAFLQLAMQARERKDRQQMSEWLNRARNMVDTPPVSIPPEVAAAWGELRATVKQMAGKGAGLLGALR